jgi:hypothetical protein
MAMAGGSAGCFVVEHLDDSIGMSSDSGTEASTARAVEISTKARLGVAPCSCRCDVASCASATSEMLTSEMLTFPDGSSVVDDDGDRCQREISVPRPTNLDFGLRYLSISLRWAAASKMSN